MKGSSRPGLAAQAAWAAWILALGLLAPSIAAAARVHVLEQATHLTQGTIWEPNIRQGRGEYVTFVSDGDVMGPGTAHIGKREVYLWNRSGTRKITSSPAGESYDASRVTDDYRTLNPAIVTFVSTADLDPSVGNADGNPEIFLWLLETGEFRQLTDTLPPVVNAAPYPSDTTECITFQSNGDLDDNDGSYASSAPTGFYNQDGSTEVFYIDFHDHDFREYHTTQISDGPAGTTSSMASVGGYFFPNQCFNMEYQSDHDQLGNGSTGTNVYDFRRGSASLVQLTLPGNLGASSIEPRISGTGVSAGGPSVVFASDGNLLNNGSVGFQIFKFPVIAGSLRQVTASPTGGNRHPAVSDGSAVVVFSTTGEVADPSRPARRGPDGPYNADGNSEIIRLVGRRVIRPITRSVGCTNDEPSIMGNGSGLAFRSDCDLVAGFNLYGQQQIFVYYDIPNALFDPASCSIAEGCCSTDNGCYEEVVARSYRVPRPLR